MDLLPTISLISGLGIGVVAVVLMIKSRTVDPAGRFARDPRTPEEAAAGKAATKLWRTSMILAAVMLFLVLLGSGQPISPFSLTPVAMVCAVVLTMTGNLRLRRLCAAVMWVTIVVVSVAFYFTAPSFITGILSAIMLLVGTTMSAWIWTDTAASRAATDDEGDRS